MSGACGRLGAQRLGRAPAGGAGLRAPLPAPGAAAAPCAGPSAPVPGGGGGAASRRARPALWAGRCRAQPAASCGGGTAASGLPCRRGRPGLCPLGAGAASGIAAIPGGAPSPPLRERRKPCPVPAAASRRWCPGQGSTRLGKFRAASREGGRREEEG
ncbi:translation initiation factor IF-2-like [Motacilla alba alba]|uniref:translation initiation factor IF-2-like n=1 Tax=Motacilla alba alba TaxID=1094192 RepID=UPI0018D53B55|nr:translation initiation factor IF-2-like [Motacilla alba alba]